MRSLKLHCTQYLCTGLVAIVAAAACGDDDGPGPVLDDAGVTPTGDAGVDSDDTSSDTDTSDDPSSTDGTETTLEPEEDAGTTDDAGPDAASDAGPDADVEGADADTTDTESTETTSHEADADVPGEEQIQVGNAEPTAVPVSANGDDSFLGVVFDRDGNFYAVGPAADDASGDSYMAITKFSSNGERDESFGDSGVAKVNVSDGGTDSVRAIAIQTLSDPATDYLVIAGTYQVDPSASGLAAAEQDVAVARFTMDGVLDASFGTDGVITFNLNTGTEGVNRSGDPAWAGNDMIWSLATTAEGKLVLHGSQRNETPLVIGDGGAEEASDDDWVLVRLNADGAFDETFGDSGKVTLDLMNAGASARSATVLPDGSIVGTGYLTSDVLGQSSQQPVLYKVTPDGKFDASFATDDAIGQPGVFHDFVVDPPLRAEAYGAAPQGDAFVTMGYGPALAGEGSDFIALRFTADGAHDDSFGIHPSANNPNSGTTYIDAEGQSDNGRSLVVLPDGQILGIGGGRRAPSGEEAPPSDGMLVLLSRDGVPVESFGPGGVRLYDFGSSTDFFWAGAVSPDESRVAVVGLRGGTGEGADADSDGVVLVLPLGSAE